MTVLLSNYLKVSFSVPGKCLVTAEKFDTKTTWGGSSLRYSVAQNVRYLLGPFRFQYTSRTKIYSPVFVT